MKLLDLLVNFALFLGISARFGNHYYDRSNFSNQNRFRRPRYGGARPYGYDHFREGSYSVPEHY